MIKNVNFKRPPVIFDVGCTICHPALDDFTGNCLGTYEDCKVFGFEPVKWHSYEEKYSKDNRVVLIKKALSDSSGNFSFYTFPGNTGISSLFYREVFKTYEDMVETNVDCTTIDEFCTKEKVEKIDYLKIDAEGAEFKILNGAKRMLRDGKISNIQFEFHESLHTVDAGFSMDDIESMLNEYGLVKNARTHNDYLFVMENCNG